MFHCVNCKQPAFLIRNLCQQCAPKLHADHQFMLNAIGNLSEEFEQQTGISSLADWCGFEEFIASRLANTRTGERFVEILETK